MGDGGSKRGRRDLERKAGVGMVWRAKSKPANYEAESAYVTKEGEASGNVMKISEICDQLLTFLPTNQQQNNSSIAPPRSRSSSLVTRRESIVAESTLTRLCNTALMRMCCFTTNYYNLL